MSAFASRLDDIAAQRANPATVLAEMDFADLTSVLEARFPSEALERLDYLGHGRSRRAGDVCGVLAMSRDVADQLRQLEVPYIYAVEHGDTRDFAALKHVDEGDWICLSGTDATARRGRLDPELSPVARLYQLIEAIVDDAVAIGHADHPADALVALDRSPTYLEHASELAELASHPTVRGFEDPVGQFEFMRLG
ncbi:MAG: hypothetical protein ACRDRZ_17905 [Pseudonocardiaceae bacterium]